MVEPTPAVRGDPSIHILSPLRQTPGRSSAAVSCGTAVHGMTGYGVDPRAGSMITEHFAAGVAPFIAASDFSIAVLDESGAGNCEQGTGVASAGGCPGVFSRRGTGIFVAASAAASGSIRRMSTRN